jgi:hypothetical protein
VELESNTHFPSVVYSLTIIFESKKAAAQLLKSLLCAIPLVVQKSMAAANRQFVFFIFGKFRAKKGVSKSKTKVSGGLLKCLELL